MDTSPKQLPILKPRHQRFVNEYLKSLNASQAYKIVYPKSKNPDSDGCILKKREDISQVISSRLAAQVQISKEEWLQSLHDARSSTKTDSVRVRYAELIGKALGYLRDTDITLTMNQAVISQDAINERIEAKRNALRKSNTTNAIQNVGEAVDIEGNTTQAGG